MSSIEPCETCGYPNVNLAGACVDCLTRLIEDPYVTTLIRERHAALRERLRATDERLRTAAWLLVEALPCVRLSKPNCALDSTIEAFLNEAFPSKEQRNG